MHVAQGIAPVGYLIEGVTDGAQQELEADWRSWVTELFPQYVSTFAPFHADYWQWLWAIEPGVRPRPFIGVWARGAAKSTSAELGCVALGARGQRRYVLYVSETQEQADDHVANIAAMLESSRVEAHYPEVSNRLLGKYGNSRGWRRNRLRTASGFTIDAMGLDSAARGAKLEEARPDAMIIDDIDGENDSPSVVQKKIRSLTRKLIPAGSADLAILAIQNLVHPDSIFSRLVDGRADFLADRIVSGPYPALEDMAYEQRGGRYVITGGEPTWDGMDIDRCQELLKDIGLTAFLSECQHEVEPSPGGLFNHLDYQYCAWDDVPELVRVVVWVDPAVTDTSESDAHGIQADGLGIDGKVYRLWSWEDRKSPEGAIRLATLKAVELKAEAVGIETDQGGDTWRTVYDATWQRLIDAGEIEPDTRKPQFRSEKAGAGHGPKVHRASLMLAAYEKGQFVHVLGTHTTLERALHRFPKTKPFDLTDAAYWSWHDLTAEKPEFLIGRAA